METISEIAVPLKVGVVVAAEVIWVCVFTNVLDLFFRENKSVAAGAR